MDLSRTKFSRLSIAALLLNSALFGFCQTAAPPAPQISHDDLVRVREFYRFAPQVEDSLWPQWSDTPAPLLLITQDNEFLTHFPSVPSGFTASGEGFFARPRQFPIALEATFPAFGPPAIIAIGEPQNTAVKTSTPWLIVLMHEHFHQLQYAQPDYDSAVAKLGLGQPDDNGMWMLNYPFPYSDPTISARFAGLRDLLLQTLQEKDPRKFASLTLEYRKQRREFLAGLTSNDHKYFSFQLWQEGVARYIQIKAAEAASSYQPTPEFAALPDYTPFASAAASARKDTIDELRQLDLPASKRVAFYAFGAAEALLLDRMNPAWKSAYFQHLLSTDPLFADK